MSSLAGSKNQLFALLFAWPLAVLIGWLLARVTHTDWPAAAMPIAWLGVLFRTLRDYAPRDLTNASR